MRIVEEDCIFHAIIIVHEDRAKVAVRSVVTHHLASVKGESDDNREKCANSVGSQEQRISAVCLPTFEDLLSLVSNRYVFPWVQLLSDVPSQSMVESLFI